MPVDPTLRDDKNNLVFITLFESYLAKFILEHPAFYKAVYVKLIKSLELFFDSRTLPDNEALSRLLSGKRAGYDLDRHLFSIFTRLNEAHPGCDSFSNLIAQFSLPAADFFIKMVCDELLTPPPGAVSLESFPSPMSFFSGGRAVDTLRRSPYQGLRNPLLFHESNRGVTEISRHTSDDSSEEDEMTQDLGIVSKPFIPKEFKCYFARPISPAGYSYRPNEKAHVATWLRERDCPIISGASGSTEMLFSRVFSLFELTEEERRMLIFAQACNMIAQGHHSFFEAFIVANHFGYPVIRQENMLNFYLQCIPDTVRANDEFMAFLASETIYSLPLKTNFPSVAGLHP